MYVCQILFRFIFEHYRRSKIDIQHFQTDTVKETRPEVVIKSRMEMMDFTIIVLSPQKSYYLHIATGHDMSISSVHHAITRPRRPCTTY